MSEGETKDKRYWQIKERMPEAMIKRVMDFAGSVYGTPYGLMMARGDITKAQYAACKWFDELYEKYLAAIDQKRGIRSSTGERTDAGHSPDPFSPVGWKIAKDENAVVRQFDSARLVGMGRGLEAFKVFWAIVIEGGSLGGYKSQQCIKTIADDLDKYRTRSWKSRRKDYAAVDMSQD